MKKSQKIQEEGQRKQEPEQGLKIKGESFEIELKKVPKENSTIIEGFPGMGFVATIVCDYMIKHLNAEYIGSIFSKKFTPLTTIHQEKIIKPIEIFYDESNNIVLIQSNIGSEGIEYDIADIILEFAKRIKASQIITIEGVVAYGRPSEGGVYYFTSNPKFEEILNKKGIKKMREGIIVGVTGALLLRAEDFPLVGFFVEVHSEMPDNKASAEIIKALDTYLNLNIDYSPLLKKAEEIEKRIKTFLDRILSVKKEKEKRTIGYAG